MYSTILTLYIYIIISKLQKNEGVEGRKNIYESRKKIFTKEYNMQASKYKSILKNYCDSIRTVLYGVP